MPCKWGATFCVAYLLDPPGAPWMLELPRRLADAAQMSLRCFPDASQMLRKYLSDLPGASQIPVPPLPKMCRRDASQMSPRCFPDVSQMFPGWLLDVSQMSPDTSQISPGCLSDASPPMPIRCHYKKYDFGFHGFSGGSRYLSDVSLVPFSCLLPDTR
jgi:hypothetical protein